MIDASTKKIIITIAAMPIEMFHPLFSTTKSRSEDINRTRKNQQIQECHHNYEQQQEEELRRLCLVDLHQRCAQHETGAERLVTQNVAKLIAKLAHLRHQIHRALALRILQRLDLSLIYAP